MHGILSIIKFYCAWKIDWKIKTVTGYDETIYNEFKTFQVRCTKNLWQQHQSKKRTIISKFSYLFFFQKPPNDSNKKKQKQNNKQKQLIYNLQITINTNKTKKTTKLNTATQFKQKNKKNKQTQSAATTYTKSTDEWKNKRDK